MSASIRRILWIERLEICVFQPWGSRWVGGRKGGGEPQL